MSTSKFLAQFSRYKNGVNTVSGPFAIQATDFQDAFSQANMVRYGMEQADKAGTYRIERIRQDNLLDPVFAGGYVFDLFRMEDEPKDEDS